MASGKLAAAIAPGASDGGVRTATVTAINTAGTGIRVTMDGGTVPTDPSRYLTCLSSYFPRVGDTVVLYRQGASWIAVGTTSRTTQFSQYTGGATSLTGGAWTVLPMSTLVTGPAISNNGSGIFTLGKAGVWTVTFALHVAPGTATGLFAGLFADVARSVIYADGYSAPLASLEAATVGADILSDGTTTVSAQAFSGVNAATVSSGNGVPRLTFRLNP